MSRVEIVFLDERRAPEQFTDFEEAGVEEGYFYATFTNDEGRLWARCFPLHTIKEFRWWK